MMNQPPSEDVLLTDILDLSPLAEAREVQELLDTTGGPFCFVYE